MFFRIRAILLVCLVVSYSQAHGWQELAKPELTQMHIEALLVIVESQNVDVDTSNLEALEGQVYAKDWLEHFSTSIKLDTYEGQASFTELIKPLYPDQENVFLNWQHDMEHIVHVYDAFQHTIDIDETSILLELENLSLDEETADTASFYRVAELSYLLSFIDISDADMAVIAPFSTRISQLIESAKGRE